MIFYPSIAKGRPRDDNIWQKGGARSKRSCDRCTCSPIASCRTSATS